MQLKGNEDAFKIALSMEGIVWGRLPSAAKMTGAVEYLEIKPRANGSGSGWLSGKGQLGTWAEE